MGSHLGKGLGEGAPPVRGVLWGTLRHEWRHRVGLVKSESLFLLGHFLGSLTNPHTAHTLAGASGLAAPPPSCRPWEARLRGVLSVCPTEKRNVGKYRMAGAPELTLTTPGEGWREGLLWGAQSPDLRFGCHPSLSLLS